MNFYAMTDAAIAQELGRRIEQIRLENNMTQQKLADEIGVTAKTYRSLMKGQGRFVNIIGVLRALNSLDFVDGFIPESEFSPMELLKLQGTKRQRASRVKNYPGEQDPGWQVAEPGEDW